MRLKLGLSFGLSTKRSAREASAPPAPHHAVSIRPGRISCDTAQGLSSRRFLSEEAPLLPLADCDRAGECSCSYRHHADRRDGPRRQSEGAPSTGVAQPESERREAAGRRAEDRLEDDSGIAGEPDESNLVADTYYGYGRRRDEQ